MNIIKTLGKGKRAKEFGYTKSENGVILHTGENLNSVIHFTNSDINGILAHFKDRGWFVLGNQIDAVKENGLGSFIKSEIKKSPKFASHLASYLVINKFLIYRTTNGYIELLVNNKN